MDNLKTLLLYFYKTSGIPITHFDYRGQRLANWPESNKSFRLLAIAHQEINPYIYQLSSGSFYCNFYLNDQTVLCLGPIFNIPISNRLIQSIMIEHCIELAHQTEVAEVLYRAPRLSFSQFFDQVSFLYYLLFNEELDINDPPIPDSNLAFTETTLVKKIFDYKEARSYHNTYQWEKKVYSCIQIGNIPQLTALLNQQSDTTFTEGVMADDPLRQAKNIFIGTVTKVGMLSAIPGGLDVEETYHLIDTYTHECERFNNIDGIHQLHYRMVIDFCNRIANQQIPSKLSEDTRESIRFIRNHTNEPICISDISNHVNRSDSYIVKHFKKELGITPRAYIQKCKLEEAKRLLQYTDKTLSEISFYLCFSSQSYFQNVFKSVFHITPSEYRRQAKTY